MSDDLSEHHDELRAVARDLLARTASTGGHDAGPRSVDWSLVAESGWLGLDVPEALDGSGATFAEVGVILEEMGRAAAVSPYLGCVVLGLGALELVEAGERRDDLLRRVAVGERTIAAALGDGALDRVDGEPAFRLASTPEGPTLHGRADFVPDAVAADELLLVTAGPDGTPVVVALPASTPGLSVVDQPVLDATRQLAVVVADGVVVDDRSVLRFVDPAAAGPGLLHDRAALAIAHDSLGIARGMLEATVGHVSERRQFDRAIGSFQAVKHACADMLVQVTVVEELVRSASSAFCTRDPGAALAVSRAKARASEVAVEVAGEAMQLHGGIGYTWESGIHVHLKRAVLDRALFGSPAAHRRRLAAAHLATPGVSSG